MKTFDSRQLIQLIAIVALVCLNVVPADGAPGSVLWSLNSLTIWRGPALGPDGTIYVLEKVDERVRLVAISGSSQIQWRRDVSIDPNFPAFPMESLTVDNGGNIYVSDNHLVTSFDARGNLLFTYPIPDDYLFDGPCFGSQGNIYLTKLGNGQPSVLCLNRNRELLWTRSSGDDVSVLTLDGDGSVYARTSGFLVTLNSDGKRRWSYPTGTASPTPIAIARDGTVFLFSGNGSSDVWLTALDPYTSNPFGKTKWRRFVGTRLNLGTIAIGPDGTVYFTAGDTRIGATTPSGTLLWEFETSARSPLAPSFAVGREGTLYAMNDQELYAVSKAGNLRWLLSLDPLGPGSVVLSKSGALYVAWAGLGGRLMAVDTGLASVANPWPLRRGDAERSGRSPVLTPATGFSRVRSLPDHSMELLIDGPPLHTYTIEESQDFTHWRTNTTVASSNRSVQVLVPLSPQSSRKFFRLGHP